jgi:hypothetical protein
MAFDETIMNCKIKGYRMSRGKSTIVKTFWLLRPTTLGCTWGISSFLIQYYCKNRSESLGYHLVLPSLGRLSAKSRRSRSAIERRLQSTHPQVDRIETGVLWLRACQP